MTASNHHETSHYIEWDSKVEHLFGTPPGEWEESDRGPDYIRFSDGEEVVHFARLKLLTGVMYVVQVPDGPNDFETIHQGSDEAIARNNALGVMAD
jgi:hypothetical protein